MKKWLYAAVIIGVAVVAVSFIFALSQPHQIVNPIMVSTDKSYYQTGSPATIMINFLVKSEVYRQKENVQLQIVDGNRTVFASQNISDVQPDINMTYPLKLGGKESVAGEYWVLANYRGFDSQASFQYEGFKPNAVNCSLDTLCTYTVEMRNSSTHPINFRFNGTIENMVANTTINYLTIELNSDKPTSLQIAIPRDVADSRAGISTGADEDFVVFADEEPIAADEITVQAREWTIALGISENPEKYRILIIPIDEGIEKVEIVGTWPI